MKYLIVPMVVESFISGKNREEHIPMGAPDYQAAPYRSYLGSANTPRPFNRDAPGLKPGVHLHFVLPDGFTRADERGDYRAVPNRYLVTRIALGPEGGARVKRWLVESDFLSDDARYAGNVTFPMFSDGTSGSMFRYGGRCLEEGEAPLPGGAYMEKLTAVGAGDPAFGAYYPSCHSVFGFYDAMDGISEGSRLTYFVLGYFSDRTQDPLTGVYGEEDFRRELSELGFFAEDCARPCEGILLFGEAASLCWLGGEHDYGKNIPQGEIDVAVGNTSAEALGALLGEKLGEKSGEKRGEKQGKERWITAMQYALLDSAGDMDGNFKIDDGIHAQGFEALNNTAGGLALSWEAEDGALFHRGKEYSDLIKKREEKGAQEGYLSSLQGRLFLLWERYMHLEEKGCREGDSGPEEIQREIEKTVAQIQEKQSLLNRLGEELQGMEKSFAGKLPKGAQCREKGGEAFYRPKDPAVLFSGQGINRSFAFGEDGRFREDGLLLCQTQSVSFNKSPRELTVLFEGFEGLGQPGFQGPDSDPEECYASLFCQAVLLDPGTRKWAEEKLGVLTVEGSYSPLLLSVAPQEYTTLYMDWSVRFYPTRTSKDGEPDNTLAGWDFPYGETNYVYEGSRSRERNLVYTGRTVVTPHAVHSMKNMLCRWLEEHSQDQEAKEIAAKLQDLPVLSQTLGGLNEKLCGLEYGIQFPPMGDGEAGKVAALVGQFLGEEALSGMASTPLFSLRGGHFRLDRLEFVSSFGQVQHCIVSPEAGTGMQKIKYAETIAGGDPDYGVLTPGFCQPTRLAVQWRSAADRECISSIDGDTASVCGFLLPEILNRRLLAYSGERVYLGMLKSVWREGRQETRWVGAPGREEEPGALECNGVLKKFLCAVLEGNTLADILRLADGCFEKTLEPETVSLIWGRPLVLARGSLQLLGRGTAPFTQDYGNPGSYNTQGVEAVSVPVHLGDANRVGDGVVGVFPDGPGEEGSFDTLIPAWGTEPFDSKYVCFDACVRLSYEDGERFFTVLMEAGTECTLQTGLLPVQRLRLPGEQVRAAEHLLTAAEFTNVLTTRGKAQLPLVTPGKPGRYLWCSREQDGKSWGSMEEAVAPVADFAERYLCDGMLIKCPGKETQEE